MIFLDTNICIAHLNDDTRVTDRLVRHVAEICVSTIVVAELFYGFGKSARATQNISRLRQFLRAVQIIPFDRESAEIAGATRVALERIGKPPPVMDLLIGTAALRHQALLVTHNTRDFQNIPNLRLEDWLS